MEGLTRKEKITFLIIGVLAFLLLSLVSNESNEDYKRCIEEGNTKQYCEGLLIK